MAVGLSARSFTLAKDEGKFNMTTEYMRRKPIPRVQRVSRFSRDEWRNGGQFVVPKKEISGHERNSDTKKSLSYGN